MNEIKMIPIDQLQPHPDNPRRDVGDVSELAASIRHSGIMQNLTVVPHGDGYRVIIGHRRLAAAKEAGLAELPCKIVDMTESEQLSTMIAENMQRVDLTVPEQVRGIQMMLDLGDTPEQVMHTTGLSRTTFYHRKAMAALPQDELQKSWERGGTLADYVALEGIKDDKVRSFLLKQIGTSNFSYELRKAKDDQDYLQRLDEVLVLLEPVLPRVKSDSYGTDTWRTVRFRDKDWKAEIKKLIRDVEQQTQGEFAFFIGKNEWNKWEVKIRRKLSEDEQTQRENARDKREREAKKRREALIELNRRIKTVRLGTVGRFQLTEEKKKAIAAFWITHCSYISDWQKPNFMRSAFGSEGEDERLEKAFDSLCEADPAGMMLTVMVYQCQDMIDYSGKYYKREKALDMRRLLWSIDYRESDEETAYWTGTHELFWKEEDNV